MDRRRSSAAATVVLAVAVVLAPGWLAALAGLSLLGIAAWWARRDGVRSSGAVAAVTWGCVGLAGALSFGVVWPIPQAIGLVVAAAALGRAGVRAPRWIQPGTADRLTSALAIATVPATTAALVAFIASGRTDLEAATEGLDQLPTWTLPAVGVGFAIVNPTVEEVLFRGVLHELLVEVTHRPTVAIVGSSVAFGAIHLAGVPGGPLGMVMAAGWGAVLGVVRHRSGSIHLPWLVHVAANATIFTTITVLAVRDGVL